MKKLLLVIATFIIRTTWLVGIIVFVDTILMLAFGFIIETPVPRGIQNAMGIILILGPIYIVVGLWLSMVSSSPKSKSRAIPESRSAIKLKWPETYFYFGGRIGPQTFWIHGVVPFSVGAFLASIIQTSYEVNGVVLVYSLLILYPAVALSVKRMHDLNLSGWWVLIGLLPIVGPILAFIILGFFSGTDGPNDYGPGPDSYYGAGVPIEPPASS